MPKQTIASAQTHAAFPVILCMDKAKHGEASYPQLLSDAKYNRVVRADGDHNALNRDVFLGKKVGEC